MSSRGRHGAAIAAGLAVLPALVLLRPTWHAPVGLALFAAVRLVDPPLRRALGAPARWLVPTLVLALLGAWLGPPDARLLHHPVSLAGALAAATMVSRAVALLTVSSALMALVPPASWVARLRHTRFARLGEVVLVAVDLLPSLAGVLRAAHAESRKRAPGALRAPARLFEVFVIAMDHASSLADEIARDLSAPSARQEER